MLNAVLTALHLLNIREEFFLLLFFFLELESLFCHLEDSVFFVSRLEC